MVLSALPRGMVHPRQGGNLRREGGLEAVSVVEGAEYTQLGGFPVMVTADGFTMTEERYQELRKLPWPEPNEETIVTRREIVDPELLGLTDRERELSPGTASLLPGWEDIHTLLRRRQPTMYLLNAGLPGVPAAQGRRRDRTVRGIEFDLEQARELKQLEPWKMPH